METSIKLKQGHFTFPQLEIPWECIDFWHFDFVAETDYHMACSRESEYFCVTNNAPKAVFSNLFVLSARVCAKVVRVSPKQKWR